MGDPTVAKSMDELLAQLQQKFRGSHGPVPFTNSFSLPMSGQKSLGCAEMKWTLSASDGGVTSMRLSRIVEESTPFSRIHDDTSECSTACSTPPNSESTHV